MAQTKAFGQGWNGPNRSAWPKPAPVTTALATKPGKKARTSTPADDVSDLVWTSRAGWACVKNCGACCVLDKGPDYPPIEEILSDPALAERMGQEAAAIVAENRGAAVRTVENLKQILTERGG